ncbi:uncharacterized protein LOC131534972 [Onychostoma macrolepis]|uniref:uncharacterized protein LOC131534972 n=1 Tax=Onychostoma macrolepis TaxID=369639 RepID=UPI00272CAB93|nr:uncharacterized protein LOC131534972 [Onychostoma macrolepis]
MLWSPMIPREHLQPTNTDILGRRSAHVHQSMKSNISPSYCYMLRPAVHTVAIRRSQTPRRPRVSGHDVTPLTSSSLCYLKVTALGRRESLCGCDRLCFSALSTRGGATGTSGAAVSPKSRKSVPEVPQHPPHVSFLFPPSFSLASLKPSDRVSLIAVLKRSLCAPLSSALLPPSFPPNRNILKISQTRKDRGPHFLRWVCV